MSLERCRSVQFVCSASDSEADWFVTSTEISLLPSELGKAPLAPDTWASRLIVWAARVLPVAHRCRYSQEFHSELAELAQRGRLVQVRYSLCLLWSVVGLRRALRDVVPEVESW